MKPTMPGVPGNFSNALDSPLPSVQGSCPVIKDVDIAELEKILQGTGSLLRSPEELLAYSYDASRGRTPADVVVIPDNAGSVRDIMRFASKRKIPVYPRGSGTGMTGGSLPERGGIALVTTSMNRILDIDTTNLTVRVQPGVILDDLKKAVGEKGLFYPPDPASARFATVGGTVAVNSGGLNSVKYGVTRDYVLSLETVSARGDIMRFGAATRKSVTGYDMVHLLVGSEGTLAVITEIVLKLLPRPSRVETLLAAFPDDMSALRGALDIVREPLVPSALEFMDEAAVQCARSYTGNPFLEGAGGLLLVEFDHTGFHAGKTESGQLVRCREILGNAGMLRIEQTHDPLERERLWEIRRCLSPAVYDFGPTKKNEDICVPRSEMPFVVKEIKRIAGERGIRVVNFAHAGDGNIHVNFMYNGEDEGETARTRNAVEELFRLTISRGGTLSGEHGIGRTKSPFLPLEYGIQERRLMREIKKLFDPDGILNPDKILPRDEEYQ